MKDIESQRRGEGGTPRLLTSRNAPYEAMRGDASSLSQSRRQASQFANRVYSSSELSAKLPRISLALLAGSKQCYGRRRAAAADNRHSRWISARAGQYFLHVLLFPVLIFTNGM